MLYVPWFNFDGPPESKFQILRFFDFQALASEFVFAQEPTVLRLEGSSFGIRDSIYILIGCYDRPPRKVPRRVILGEKVFLRPCAESLF